MKKKTSGLCLIGYLLGVCVGALGWDRVIVPPHQPADLYAILVCMALVVGLIFGMIITYLTEE